MIAELDLPAEGGPPPIDDDSSGDDDFDDDRCPDDGCTGHDCDDGDDCACYSTGYTDGEEDGWVFGYMAATGCSLVEAEAAFEARWLDSHAE